jgi:hypothetical protein
LSDLLQSRFVLRPVAGIDILIIGRVIHEQGIQTTRVTQLFIMTFSFGWYLRDKAYIARLIVGWLLVPKAVGEIRHGLICCLAKIRRTRVVADGIDPHQVILHPDSIAVC